MGGKRVLVVVQALIRATCIVLCALAAAPLAWAGPVRKRALLIGINDYAGSPPQAGAAVRGAPDRKWKNLKGALNDVEAMHETLVTVHGFDARDIVVLTDRRATLAAIVSALQDLAAGTRGGDVVFFYFAGHGSRVTTTSSDERDRVDETLVPADSRYGAPDLRDKKLRGFFNRILDRGGRLWVVLDSCYSGSAFRGVSTDTTVRGVNADPRGVRDASAFGPKPDDRGALIVSAAQDDGLAFEIEDEQGKDRGAFSWAWIHAMRQARPGEAAIDTFRRAAARLTASGKPQYAVLAGNEETRRRPFLDGALDSFADRSVVSVEGVRDGVVYLHGGWLHGLTVGTELRPVGKPDSGVRVEVTALVGLARSKGRVRSSAPAPGSLLEIVSWAAPAPEALRVQFATTDRTAADLEALARTMAADAARRGIRWITDPLERSPEYLLRWNDRWELVAGDDARGRSLGVRADAVWEHLPRGASLFVQWPVPKEMARRLAIGSGTRVSAVQPVDDAGEADYLLIGRFAERLQYTWVRPFSLAADRQGVLPARTDWHSWQSPAMARGLIDAALRLRRIRAWQLLDAPPGAEYPYRLSVRRRGEEVARAPLVGEERYTIALRSTRARMPERVPQRYVYAFVVDSFGASTLLFPRNAAVENCLPLEATPPVMIELGEETAFRAAEPYGIDTYLLLTTDVPLSDPWVLQWDGVRTSDRAAATPLEQLLTALGSPERSVRRRIAQTWSLERVIFESIPPGGRRTGS